MICHRKTQHNLGERTVITPTAEELMLLAMNTEPQAGFIGEFIYK